MKAGPGAGRSEDAASMATGDVSGNMERMCAALRSVRYAGAGADDFGARAAAGDPGVFLHALHHALLVFSRHVAGAILKCGYELHAKTDMRFVECVQKLLATEFSYRMTLTPRQFFSGGFAERKMMLVHDVVQLCRRRHNEMARKVQGRQLAARGRSAAAYRHSKLREVHNDTIRVRVAPAAGAEPPREQVVYHVGADGDGKLKRKAAAARIGAAGGPAAPAPARGVLVDEDDDDAGLLRSRSAAEVPRPHDKGAGPAAHAFGAATGDEEDGDDDEEEDLGFVRAPAADDDGGSGGAGPRGAPSAAPAADELVQREFLDRIRALMVHACGRLESKIEAVHGHTTEMERRLAARVTILEGRVKFLEHRRGLPVEANASLPPEPARARGVAALAKRAAAEGGAADARPTTPPARAAAPPVAARSTLPASLPTADFIAAVEENFRKARRIVSEI